MRRSWTNYLPYALLLPEKRRAETGPLRNERLRRIRAAHTNPKIKSIPLGAVMVPLPNVPQPDGISCGDAGLLSILLFFGVGVETIRKVKKKLHTNKEGTYYRNIVAYADRLGLLANAVKRMT